MELMWTVLRMLVVSGKFFGCFIFTVLEMVLLEAHADFSRGVLQALSVDTCSLLTAMPTSFIDAML